LFIFKELLTANSIQTDAVAVLLIEKGIFSKEAFLRTLKTVEKDNHQKPFKMNGEIFHTGNDGVGVTFKIESQLQRMVLRSYNDMIQG
jgi:hypothetical protein